MNSCSVDGSLANGEGGRHRFGVQCAWGKPHEFISKALGSAPLICEAGVRVPNRAIGRAKDMCEPSGVVSDTVCSR